jgi:hyaluronoglucosaminidase
MMKGGGMDVELGTIEGFYGRPWTWEEREATIAFLAPHGYRFYLYAPKADVYLRRRWKEPHPADWAEKLVALAAHCRALGVRFGLGISPFEIFAEEFDAAAREALERKLDFADELGVQDLAILFDDMRGDMPGLAERQAEIVDWAMGNTRASRIIVCPSYYTDDPVLDRVFGQRPAGYLEQLGKLLDPTIQVFWTGEEVVTREYSLPHLQRVAEQLRRRPLLWDNYPVNDGQRMSQYLHLRGFTGRPPAMAGHIAAHGVNPALQAVLTRIPMLTLAERYRQGDGYAYLDATRRAAATVLGETLGQTLSEDVLFLQDVGLDRLGEKEKLLRERYTGVDHPGAREIIAWLDGTYRITDEIVQTQ